LSYENDRANRWGRDGKTKLKVGLRHVSATWRCHVYATYAPRMRFLCPKFSIWFNLAKPRNISFGTGFCFHRLSCPYNWSKWK